MLPIVAILLIAVAGLTGAALAEEQADWLTTTKVKLELLTEFGIDGLQIGVATAEGVVTLTGTVEKRETKELAPRVVESVEGVGEVVDRIELETPEGASNAKVAAAVAEAEREVRDGILESKLRLRLVDRLGSDGFRIGTEAADGVVTLEFGPEIGVERRAEAVRVTEELEGVRRVISIEKKD